MRIVVLDYRTSRVVILDDIDTWDVEHNYDNDYERYLVDKINFQPTEMDFMIGHGSVLYRDINSFKF